jgi:hypothetical protein
MENSVLEALKHGAQGVLQASLHNARISKACGLLQEALDIADNPNYSDSEHIELVIALVARVKRYLEDRP